MNKYIHEILFKMCEMVGADPTKVDFSKKNWFQKYQWTMAEEDIFIEWIINYFKMNKEAWKELGNAERSKYKYRKWAKDFVFYCGWKYKKEG